MKTLNRRDFLRGAAIVAAGSLAAACAPKTVEKEVIKEVEVEKEVEKLVEVEKFVEVETVVEVETIVERVRGESSWSPPDLGGREYLIWGLEYDPHIETYHRLADRFEELTGAKATVEPQGWPIENSIITGMAAGLVPDVCCIVGSYILPLAEQDAVLPMEDVVFDAVGVDTDTWFSPVAIGSFQSSGKTWGVPMEGSCTSGFTNVFLDLLKEYDVEHMWPPLNGELGFRGFEEYFALAEALQQVDEDGNVTRWGLSTEGWYDMHLFGIMRTLGQDWWDPNARTFHLDSPEALEAMYLLAYKPIFELGIEAHLGEVSTESLLVGNVAVCSGNISMPATGLTMADPPVHIDVCGYPSAIPGRDALFVGEGGWGFAVPTQAENQDIGIEFAKFVTTYEANKLYCEIYGGLVSSVLTVNDDDDLFPAGELVGDAIRRAGVIQKRTVFFGTGFGPPAEMRGIVKGAVEKVRIGEATPDAALAEAQVLLQEMLARS